MHFLKMHAGRKAFMCKSYRAKYTALKCSIDSTAGSQNCSSLSVKLEFTDWMLQNPTEKLPQPCFSCCHLSKACPGAQRSKLLSFCSHTFQESCMGKRILTLSGNLEVCWICLTISARLFFLLPNVKPLLHTALQSSLGENRNFPTWCARYKTEDGFHQMPLTSGINNLWTWSHRHEDWPAFPWWHQNLSRGFCVTAIVQYLCAHNLLLSRSRLNSGPSDYIISGRTGELPTAEKAVQPSCSPGFSISAHLRSTTRTSSSQNLLAYYRSDATLNNSAPKQFLLQQLLSVIALSLLCPLCLLHPCLDAGEGVGLASLLLSSSHSPNVHDLLHVPGSQCWTLKMLIMKIGGVDLENPKNPNKCNLLSWGGVGRALDKAECAEKCHVFTRRSPVPLQEGVWDIPTAMLMENQRGSLLHMS